MSPLLIILVAYLWLAGGYFISARSRVSRWQMAAFIVGWPLVMPAAAIIVLWQDIQLSIDIRENDT